MLKFFVALFISMVSLFQYGICEDIVSYSDSLSHSRAFPFEDILDPSTHQLVKVIFVDNSNPNSGNGSFKNPYNTLAAAETASDEGDIIYVFQGDGTSSGMNSGISLKNRQRLLGSGIDHTILTIRGSEIAKATTTGSPIITNSFGIGISLANKNDVSGFIIDAPMANGIQGIGITDAYIFSNTFNTLPTNDAIFIQNSSGKYNFSKNIFNGGYNGIDIQSTVDLKVKIENNIVGSYVHAGFQVFSYGQSHIDAYIEKNSLNLPLTDNVPLAIYVNSFDSSKLDAKIVDNTIDINVPVSPYNEGIVVYSNNNATTKAIVENNNINGSLSYSYGLDFEAGDNGIIYFKAKNNQFSGYDGYYLGSYTSGLLIGKIKTSNLNNSIYGVLIQIDDNATAQIEVADNILTSNTYDLEVDTSDASSLCLELEDNKGESGYFLYQADTSIINLEPPVGNVGPITTTGTITNVSKGYCQDI